MPFLEDGLSWGNQCQELYVHQSREAETNGRQPLRHGEKGKSLCRLSLEQRTSPLFREEVVA